MVDFPLATITDGLISYLQHTFSQPELVPDEYRWSADGLQTNIYIGGTFVPDREKPMLKPYIVIERGGFSFNNTAIDNLRKSNTNTFDDQTGVDVINGQVSITVGAGFAPEASTLANFICIAILARRKDIISKIPTLRNLSMQSVGPERPVYSDSSIKRWEVVLGLFASLQMQWDTNNSGGHPFARYQIEGEKVEKTYESSEGSLTNSVLTDLSTRFGVDVKFFEKDLDGGWYKLDIAGRRYIIIEIIDDHNIRVQSEDPVTIEGEVDYKIVWNSIHLIVRS